MTGKVERRLRGDQKGLTINAPEEKKEDVLGAWDEGLAWENDRGRKGDVKTSQKG